MKKLALLMILCCVVTNGVFADFEWNVESGTWNVGANWAGGVKPNGTANINLRKSATSVCTLNTDEGVFGNRLMVQNGQTWNIENGGRAGFTWARTGYDSAATVNMSGNGTYVLNNDDLYIGEHNGSCVWTMSDTSSIVMNDPSRNDDNLYIGKDGNGTLRIIGSQVTITPARIDFGWIRTAGDEPVSTLEYVMDAGGASTIVVQRINKIGDPNSTNRLVLSATADLPAQDIVLIQATLGYTTGGKGAFDTMNGGSAAEGTLIVLGGNVYALTYQYNADGDAYNNDIALVYVQSGKQLATDPSPANGVTLDAPPTTLSWTNPDPNDGSSDITCTVYLGMAPADPNRTNMVGVTLSAGENSVEINDTNFGAIGAYPIEDANSFYWVVDCVDASAGVDPALGKAPLSWMFNTLYNTDPVVDASADQVVWGLPQNISLPGTATDDGRPNPPGTLTIAWTQISGPASAVINSPASASTTVDIAESGLYVFELSADDGASVITDTVQVIVGADSCEASYLNGEDYNQMDFDTDCDVDLIDFADFASDWQACTNTLEGCI